MPSERTREDGTPTCDQRAAWGKELVELYRQRTGATEGVCNEDCVDAISDILHFALSQNYEHDLILSRAEYHCEVEAGIRDESEI